VKFAVVSHILPPSDSGQAMVLYRLLKDFDPATYCLISQQSYDGTVSYASYSAKLSAAYHHLPPEHVNVGAAIIARGRKIADILREERCEGVVVCTGDLVNLPAVFAASQIVKIPYFIFMCDHYGYQWLNPGDRVVARLSVGRLVRSAEKTIVSNEYMAAELRAAYAVEPVLIRNPFDPNDYAEPAAGADVRKKNGAERSIVFTGAIYDVNFDAFSNVLHALGSMRQRNVKLHLYSAQRLPESIVQIAPDLVVHHPHARLEEIPAILQDADILLLPLAFNSPYPKIVKTASTAKLAEYLAAGRPLLVHAPSNTFISWYVHKERCGIVVDEPSPSRLADEIAALLADPERGAAMGKRARSAAKAEFLASDAHAKLATLLGCG
jgi:glycosyltransferase involved in cell wall biosynthesis